MKKVKYKIVDGVTVRRGAFPPACGQVLPQYRPKRESDIEKYLVKRVKALGGEVRKVKWLGREGAPDRLVMLPEVYGRPSSACAALLCGDDAMGLPMDDGIIPRDACTIWIELKKPGGEATFPCNAHERKQAREHVRMRNMGQRVEVVDSFEGVDEVLK